MLPASELQFSVPVRVSPSLEDHLELSRLLAAAVVSPAFRHMLLVDPQQAIEDGYFGETFLLSEAERYLLLFIHADTLAELAGQIVKALGMGLPVISSAYTRMPEFISHGQ